MARKKRRKKKRSVGGQIAVFVFLILFASAAGYYAYEYQQCVGKFLPNTTVNGIDYSGMTAEEAEARFRETYAGRVLTIREMGGTDEQILYDEIDYHYTTGSTFSQLIESQNLYLWPLAYTRPTVMTTEEGFAFDEEKLAQKVSGLSAITDPDIQDPVNAYITKEDTGYRIVDAVDGNRLDEEKVLSVVTDAVNAGASEVNLEEQDCYLKASVYADNEELQNEFSVIDKAQNVEITISLEGNTYETLDKSTFLPWMSYEGGTVSFSSEAIIQYTQQLADKYNTYGKVRQFRTTEGDVVEVGGSAYDNYGYRMNVDESADVIAGALNSGISQTIALVWNHYALTRDEGGLSDFGDTYIEISLDEQHMWYYKDGEMVLDTSIVSGTATPKRATPTAVMQVLDKKTDHTMRGSYGESHADFVLNIHESGIHIHDSSWRDEYGDDIWLYDGSHGCINTPRSKMEALYEMVDISTPVIIYDRWNTVESFENEMYSPTSEDEDEDEDYDEEYDEEYNGDYEENYGEDDSYEEYDGGEEGSDEFEVFTEDSYSDEDSYESEEYSSEDTGETYDEEEYEEYYDE